VRRKAIYTAVLAGVLAMLGVAISSYAFAGSAATVVTADTLSGYLETPALVSNASGTFTATINDSNPGGTDVSPTISYTLTYAGVTSGVTQAHIHIGQRSVAGGISAFLCSNLGNGPPGTQPCPSPSGTVTGTIRAAQVVGPAVQGVAPGEFAKLVQAIRAGRAYANVHSTQFPAGEIRAQINDQDQLDN
jgi:hypothetical protein